MSDSLPHDHEAASPRPLQRRPHGSGDAWVQGPDGSRFWGTFGAAGLLAWHAGDGVLLQHRVEWSHFGGTWGLPGGARHEGESAIHGALREANEEAGVPEALLTPRFTSVLELGWWSYTTVVARAAEHFEAVIGDAESLELRWVSFDEVGDLPLHPGFGAAWPSLRPSLETEPVLVVDAANVVGSRPDGWWRDRAGANRVLAAKLSTASLAGLPAALLGLPQTSWWPRVRMVVEGQAKTAADAAVAGIQIVASPHDGDAQIVAEVEAAVSSSPVTVVTSDRGLTARVEALGARVVGSGTLLAHLDTLAG